MRKNSAIKILVCVILVLFIAACTYDKSNSIDSSINNGESTADITQDNSNDIPVNNNDPIISENGGNNTSIDKPDPGVEPAPELLPEPAVPEGNMNPLTGLYDGISDQALNHKPVAIVLGNSLGGVPQWGVENADIIYEMIVEGGITRYMALFLDQDTDRIGSIRSSRHYYLDYALENDAIYVHFG